MLEPGLYVVATPIGNLGDLSSRAIQTLSVVSTIYAEDTRHTQKLLSHFDIQTELRSLHQHNEAHRIDEVKSRIRSGDSIALVTDAGTPGISDPGSYIVSELLKDSLKVAPIPGASSLTSALSAAGYDHLDSGTLWLGFLPNKSKARREKISEIQAFSGVVTFLESPHRIKATASDLQELMPEREITVCRELTKRYETVSRMTCDALPEYIGEGVKGELTLVLGPVPPTDANDPEDALVALEKLLDAGLSAKDASKAIATLYGLPKRDLYRHAIQRAD